MLARGMQADTRQRGAMQLTGQAALVTGAAAGPGPGLARALCAAGARLGLADAGAAALSAELDAWHAGADPQSAVAMAALCDRMAGSFGAPDHVIVNLLLPAGPRAPDTMAEAEFDATLGRLIRPVFLSARAFLPAMRARGAGSLLVVATRPGPMRQPRDAWTAATLGWLAAAVPALAAEAAPDGVRVNALLPATEDAAPLPRFMGGRAASAPPPPLGRWAEPDGIGAAAVFLCSPGGATITGQCLALDAGRGL
jgi:3-oxoacyl-[acyl-carrier protein] reductase